MLQCMSSIFLAIGEGFFLQFPASIQGFWGFPWFLWVQILGKLKIRNTYMPVTVKVSLNLCKKTKIQIQKYCLLSWLGQIGLLYAFFKFFLWWFWVQGANQGGALWSVILTPALNYCNQPLKYLAEWPTDLCGGNQAHLTINLHSCL